jgi:site-specific DNA-adenine methylase
MGEVAVNDLSPEVINQLQALQDEYEELDRRTEQLKSVDIASRDFEELIRLIDRQLAILRAAAVLVGDLPT